MENISQNRLDEYQINLQNATNSLLKCQDSKNLVSCLQCQSILECSIRERYVRDVYRSMNKGKSGTFDF